jgi:hypothetical protein
MKAEKYLNTKYCNWVLRKVIAEEYPELCLYNSSVQSYVDAANYISEPKKSTRLFSFLEKYDYESRVFQIKFEGRFCCIDYESQHFELNCEISDKKSEEIAKRIAKLAEEKLKAIVPNVRIKLNFEMIAQTPKVFKTFRRLIKGGKWEPKPIEYDCYY